MKTVDDEGNELPRDGKTSGHLLVKGPCVSKGYFKLEGFSNGVSQFVNISHKIIMLGHRQGYTGYITFLKGVRTNNGAANLTGEAYNGRGVHHRGGDAG